MEITTKKRWYEKRGLLLLLLFILPPLGIYGMALRDSKLWKKLVYIIGAFFMTLILFSIIVSIVVPTDYVSLGNRSIDKGDYDEAIKYYNEVAQDDDKYGVAKKGIERAIFLKDSIVQDSLEKEEEFEKMELVRKKASEEATKRFKKFQNNWADSLVTDWKGYLVGYEINNTLDTISLQLSADGTKGNGNINSINNRIYQKDYDSLQLVKFADTANNINVKIVLTLDEKQKIKNDEIAKRRGIVDRQFSPWDGSHRNLKRYVKDNMNDPSSFDHIETRYSDKGSYILVQMDFRGKNGFGALVKNRVVAKTDIDGNILSVEY